MQKGHVLSVAADAVDVLSGAAALATPAEVSGALTQFVRITSLPQHMRQRLLPATMGAQFALRHRRKPGTRHLPYNVLPCIN